MIDGKFDVWIERRWRCYRRTSAFWIGTEGTVFTGNPVLNNGALSGEMYKTVVR